MEREIVITFKCDAKTNESLEHLKRYRRQKGRVVRRILEKVFKEMDEITVSQWLDGYVEIKTIQKY